MRMKLNETGSEEVILVDTPIEAQELRSLTEADVVCAMQCAVPDEIRTKTGLIPKTYLKYCSEFVREDIDGADPLVTKGWAARQQVEILGLDKEQDVIHLEYKDGRENEYSYQRLEWVRSRELVQPEIIPFGTIQQMVEQAPAPSVGLDFEWDPADMTKPHTIGVGLKNYAAHGYLDFHYRDWLRRLVRRSDVTIVGHDLARAEIQRLFDMGIHDIRCQFEDSMTSTWEVMDNAGNVALKDLCYKHTPMVNYWYNIGDEDYKQYNDKTGTYCAHDAWASLFYLDSLKSAYAEEFEDMAYAHELDMRMLLPTAYAMWKGIGLSGPNVQKRLVTARELIKEYDDYYKELGINPRSQADILSYMHKEFGVKLASTDKKLLKAVAETVDRNAQVFIEQLLEYRDYNTTITRYLTGDLVNTPDGVVHGWHQVAKANTGRPAYSQPNIANIPKLLRDIFETTHGDKGTLLSYDRAQSEYRVVAYLSEHEELIRAFQEGVDIHSYAANEIGIDRGPCKNLNFAYLYFASDKKLEQMLREGGITGAAIDPALQKFKGCMTSIREWQEGFIKYCYDLGYIPSPYGRRGHRLRPTTIVNYPVQSWSADLNKETLLYFFHRMREEGLESHIWCEFYDGTEIDAVTEEIPVIQQIASEVFQVLPDYFDYGIEVPFPLEETIHGRYWGRD
jgi:DNA polymerase I-like protein with 3'-5' exonuclease and polymerase domains